MYDPKRNHFEKPVSEFSEKVVEIKRVSKKTKGGNQIHFTALVVVGDKKSRVGVALAKARSVADAVTKASKRAQKNLITVPLVDGTIAREIKLKFKSARIIIRPGKKGSGMIVGGPVRSVVELVGIKDIVGKVFGTKTKSLNVWATFKALSKLK